MTSRPFGSANVLRRLSLAALLSVEMIDSAAAASFVLPALVTPASTERHAGKVIWVDLVTPDIAGAKRFYGELFGWSFHDIHTADSDYSVALLEGRPVGGLYQRPVR